MNGAKPTQRSDVRWQLIERITASTAFNKSGRLKDLLWYLAEKTLRGDKHDLSEHQLGVAVFGKPTDYNIVEDSSVRVHVRQLRLKLHEYFDAEGREESWIVEIPKGSYTAVFRTLEQKPHLSEPKNSPGRLAMRVLPWALAALFLITTLVASFYRVTRLAAAAPSWPLSVLFDNGNQPVQVVVADANFGLVRLLAGHQLTLQQYLSPAYRSGEVIMDADTDKLKPDFVNYLSGSVLTSYADAKLSMLLAQISGEAHDRLVVRSARSLSPHDFDQGNFVLLGSPTSNPWVSYFQDKLNFRVRVDETGSSTNCFDNLHPQPGEQQSYCGSPLTGSAGVNYATVSFLPLPSRHGSALILQGVHQEGTEAAGDFIADANTRRQLQTAMGIRETPTSPVYFEALIRTESIAGAPVGASSLVSARLLHP
jgi:hypothetical protein